jgi:ABC-type cobalamin/Fe3+-siderophores transport system ATPase subunit
VQLRLEQVSVARRGRALLDDVSLSLEPGQLLAVLGPNGAGKTTLLRSALGLLTPDRGQVLLAGRRLDALSPRERAARVAWLPQHSTSAEDLSALDVAQSARYRFDEPLLIAEREARRALARVGVGDVAERPLRTLSGGERQRVALAGLLAQDTPIMLVDEPANHLDPAQQIEVYRLLGELWREGRSIVCVTHDVNLLRHLGAPHAVRVVGVAHGKLKFECFFADPELPSLLGALFGVQMRALLLGDARVLLPEPKP